MDPVTAEKVVETAKKVYETAKKIEKVVNVSQEMKSVAESEGKDQIDASATLASDGKILVDTQTGKTEGKAKLEGNVSHNNDISSKTEEKKSLINSTETGGIGEKEYLWGEGIPTQSGSNDIDDEVFCQKFPTDEGQTNPDKKELVKEDNATDTNKDCPLRIKTINDALEGQRHPETGVPYNKKVVETDTGEKIEGVFPKFNSDFDVQLPKVLELATDKKQFAECNRQLKEKCKLDPEFRSKFTPEQLADIEDGITPEGYSWHHNEEKGKMQLVDTYTHDNTRHTGGKSIWGGGQMYRH